MKQSSLKNPSRFSMLEQTQLLKYGGEIQKKHKFDMAMALPLTSLIDAFAIIVIYLLIGTQGGGQEIPVHGQIQLPTAAAGLAVEKETPILRIEKGAYFLNDKPVAVTQLGVKLAELKKQSEGKDIEILIQADKQMDYAQLDPLLRAGSEAGIQKLKFAVTAK